mgnify:CR=1 FL=1
MITRRRLIGTGAAFAAASGLSMPALAQAWVIISASAVESVCVGVGAAGSFSGSGVIGSVGWAWLALS